MALTATPVSASDLSPSVPPSPIRTTTAVTRKRARESVGHRSSSSDAPVQERSPSAPGTTGVPPPLPRGRRSDSLVAGLDSARRTGTPRLSDTRRTGALHVGSGEEEVFVDADSPATLARASTQTAPATAAAAAAAQLQRTPTSQLLSQHQTQPYASATPPEELANGAAVQAGRGQWSAGGDLAPAPLMEEALFVTPATVARRPPPQSVLGEALRASASSSASRPSSHDDAVQAILRANPPTTTRPVTLRPGYAVPSPRSPLWAALDTEDEAESRRGSRTAGERGSGGVSAAAAAVAVVRESGVGGAESEEEETLLTNTQVSLFQFEEDDDTDLRGVTATAAATHPRRHPLAAQPSISLPAPGCSLNLLDEDGLHEDEETPFFVSPDREASAAAAHGGEELFSLTQEAARQERGGNDLHAALPRARRQRAVAAGAAPSASPHSRGAPLLATPSPSRRSRASVSGASPFSQLQREVEGAAAAAADAGVGAVSVPAGLAGGAAHAKAGAAVPSQRELRRRAEMLKWAERTRAFFHFIDTRPLHVTASPAKLPSPSPAGVAAAALRRSSRGHSTVTATPRLGIDAALLHKTRSAAAASMSLVRRSHSGSAVAPQQRSASRNSGGSSSNSTAFAAVVSRVKREAAAAASAAASAVTTTSTRPSTAAPTR